MPPYRRPLPHPKGSEQWVASSAVTRMNGSDDDRSGLAEYATAARVKQVREGVSAP